MSDATKKEAKKRLTMALMCMGDALLSVDRAQNAIAHVTHTGDAYDTLVNLKLTLRDTQRKLHDAINAGVAGLDSVKGET